ncbi:MAG: hypothetical protein Q9179_006566 [Wetmoreana sp. 5 TL-2023]
MRASMIYSIPCALYFLITCLPVSNQTPALPGINPTNTNHHSTHTVGWDQVIGIPDASLPDPCGPPLGQAKDKPGSASTCNATASTSLPAESPFALTCLTDNTGYTMNWTSCRAGRNSVCSSLSLSSLYYRDSPLGRDQWRWALTPPGNYNCSLAFWVPSNGSLVPSASRCLDNIFGEMIDRCEAKGGTTNVAAVNLKRLPHRTGTERDTGEAVDPAYLSEFA